MAAPEFELANLPPAELDARLAAAVTSYGVGTRSYNRSAEKKEMARQRQALTQKYLENPGPEIHLGPVCRCLSFRLPHTVEAHQALQNDHDWRPWEERYIFDQEHNCWILKIQRYQERVR